MKIVPPTLGPILGYTTATDARLWIRGDFQPAPDGYRRAFGVARLRKAGATKWGDPLYVKLPPHFDMTGVVVFPDLTADTDYEYQAGWFFAETSLTNLDETQELEWPGTAPVGFRTGTTKTTAARSYVVGSCRYLLRLFGGTIFDDRGDKAFRSVLEQIEKGNRTDGVIMMGDQIYADDLNFLGADVTIDDFLTRYRTVFGQPNIRELMSRVPTYMILDDHEIEDNWPSKASDKDWVTLYPHAIHAYQIYQCSHSPLFEVADDGRIDGTLTRFWYQFTDGCCDWFVMDSRNERVVSADPTKARMISPTQMQALLDWLDDDSGRVKLIVTSVPFFPDLDAENDDKWGGSTAQRRQILDHIFEQKVGKVIFLSGDVHCSFSAELSSPDDPDFQVISVVSSSFFWPYPHMSTSDFAFDRPLADAGPHAYQVNKPSEVLSTDNFARLNVTPDEVEIAFFARKGAALGKRTRKFR